MIETKTWFVRPLPRPRANIRLYCFPYAGAGWTAYRSWAARFSSEVDVSILQLPGRDARRKEPPIASRQELVMAISEAIARDAQGPFALFGHSMGSLVGFYVARRLRRMGLPLPRHLFLSGRRPPHIPLAEGPMDLSDEGLVRRLRNLGGIPEVLWQEPDWVAMMLPIVRADFAVNEGEPYEHEEPLPISVTVFSGSHDPVAPPSAMEEWGMHTVGSFSTEVLSGDHFFVHSREHDLVRRIEETLMPSPRP